MIKQNCLAQTSQGVRIQATLSNSDDRLFNFPSSELFDSQNNTLNAFSLGLYYAMKHEIGPKIIVSGSLGLKYRHSSFNRPFDHTLLDPTDNTRILRALESDDFFGISSAFDFERKISGKLYGAIRTDLYAPFSRTISGDGDNFPYRDNSIYLQSLEISPGLKLRQKNIDFSIFIRALRVAKKDDVLFGYWIRDELFESKSLDTHNPISILISSTYWW